jgi:hypothetical protein
MARLKEIMGITSTVAQLLGLSLLILLLTPAGRDGIAKFGLLNVLLVAVPVFLIAGTTIVLLVARARRKDSPVARTGTLTAADMNAPSNAHGSQQG